MTAHSRKTAGIPDPELIDALSIILAHAAHDQLERLGFSGSVLVSIEWADEPGCSTISAQVPSRSLLAAGLAEAA